MPFERTPEREEFERGPSAAPRGARAEREFVLDAKGEEYKNVQRSLIEMKEKLEKGNKSVEQEPLNSPRRQLAVTIGREIEREVKELTERKESLENDIRSAGGNPSEYTLQ